MSFLEHKIPPPVIGALTAAAMWGAAGLGPQFTLAPAVRMTAVAVLVVAALAFDLLGLLAFRGSRTTVNPLAPQRASALVTGGVYRVTRNPMYLGMALLLLAWGVYLSAWLAFAGPLLFVLYITRFQILPEERALQENFGEAFTRYAAQVRRWL
ncbi:isoprenylcysteine carboxylmethyltransferase family protein [Ramlibacter tataouinensis]|uniref:methyltransferase family protein n=1 Tax=Ramlibacter tataouinensis TaxID=94132 RepID=UPI0022F3AFFD|nr:isoprenylcysteine carboxylmethyltransferase family protein [Ramlibacter tataouinensis]WBY01142.1 isoprenylcysteine carboxylmethyltransferase family protein [Ramlibacter tataouinensis]